VAPSAPNSSAVARPIPREAPVIKTLDPEKVISLHFLRRAQSCA